MPFRAERTPEIRGLRPKEKLMPSEQNASGAQVPCISLLAASIPCQRWMEHRQTRINGDTRRRKRRLREKLAKLDAIRYAPAIRAAAVGIKRRVIDKIERQK